MFPGGKPPGEDFINSWYPILIALVLGLILGFRNYMRGPKCPSNEGAKGKVCVVTGGTKGIGREIAREMAMRGARVYIGARDAEVGKEAVEDITKTMKNKRVAYIKLDLASFKSVRRFAKKILDSEERIDYLFNNAGVMSQPYALTEDGNETHFQVNYLGHFLLTQLLLDRIKESAPARIVNMIAPAYTLIEPPWFEDPNYVKKPDAYTTTQSYAGAKTSVYMFTRKLAKDLEGSNVTVNCILPGIVNTDLYYLMPFRTSTFLSVSVSPLMWMLTKTAVDGAQTPLYVALAKEEEGVTGKIYKDLAIVPAVDTIPPEQLDEKWWTTSVTITQSDQHIDVTESESEDGQENEEEEEEKSDGQNEKGEEESEEGGEDVKKEEE